MYIYMYIYIKKNSLLFGDYNCKCPSKIPQMIGNYEPR